MKRALRDFVMPEAKDPPDYQLLADVEKFGWHVLQIKAEDDSPPFSFSVGLYLNYGHPEIIVIGLSPSVALQLINTAGERIASGTHFTSGVLYDQFAEGYSATFVPVHIDHYPEYLGYAIWFYRSLPAPFPALQLIWPDKQGLFPWEQGYDRRFLRLQPVLEKAT